MVVGEAVCRFQFEDCPTGDQTIQKIELPDAGVTHFNRDLGQPASTPGDLRMKYLLSQVSPEFGMDLKDVTHNLVGHLSKSVLPKLSHVCMDGDWHGVLRFRNVFFCP